MFSFFWCLCYTFYAVQVVVSRVFWDMILVLDVEVYFTSHVTYTKKSTYNVYACFFLFCVSASQHKNGPLKYILRCWQSTISSLCHFTIASHHLHSNWICSLQSRTLFFAHLIFVSFIDCYSPYRKYISRMMYKDDSKNNNHVPCPNIISFWWHCVCERSLTNTKVASFIFLEVNSVRRLSLSLVLSRNSH